MKRGTPTEAAKVDAIARLRGLRITEPTMTPVQLAKRLGMSHVTVRKYLRETRLYAHDTGRRCGCCR